MKNPLAVTSPSSPLFGHSLLSRRGDFLSSFDGMFDEMFRGAFPDFASEFGIGFSKAVYPKANVVDGDKEITIEAAVPGLTKEDVSVEVHDGTLTISAGKQVVNEINEKKYICRELKRSSFSRSFSLSESLNADKIDASFKNGLLTITIPKKEVKEDKQAPKRIEVK